MPFDPFLGEGSPTKIDYRKKATLILTLLLEDLVSCIQCEAINSGVPIPVCCPKAIRKSFFRTGLRHEMMVLLCDLCHGSPS